MATTTLRFRPIYLPLLIVFAACSLVVGVLNDITPLKTHAHLGAAWLNGLLLFSSSLAVSDSILQFLRKTPTQVIATALTVATLVGIGIVTHRYDSQLALDIIGAAVVLRLWLQSA